MKRKIVACFLFLFTAAFLFSGCSVRLSTIDELISPPQLQTLNEGIRSALESQIGTIYTLKSPMTGDNRSSFILTDFDGDGFNEAIAFYQLKNNLNTVHMMAFANDGYKWKAVQQIEGQGNGVHSVDFADFDNDGIQELVVSWEAYNDKLKRGISVYAYQGSAVEKPLAPVSTSLTFSAMAVVDMNEDQRAELLLFSIDSGKYPSEAMARLYGYTENKKWELLGETPLDGKATAYTNVCVQKNVDGQGVAVYVDATRGESSMITEKVVWDENTKNLQAPFFDTSKNGTALTLKGLRVNTQDINGDGIVEIAMQEAMHSEVNTKYAAMVSWCQAQNGVLKPVGFALINFYDGYMLSVPDAWVSKITVFYEEDTRTFTISESDVKDGEVRRDFFHIRAVSRSEWKENPLPDYQALITNGELVYVAKTIDTDGDIPYTMQDLKDNIVVYG